MEHIDGTRSGTAGRVALASRAASERGDGLSQPGVHVAMCGAGTLGQMEDNIRAAQDFRKMRPEETEDVRRRAVVGQGVHTGPTMEYWKKAA